MNPNLVYRRIETLEHTIKILIRRLEMLEGRVDKVDGTDAANEVLAAATAKARARIGA